MTKAASELAAVASTPPASNSRAPATVHDSSNSDDLFTT